MQNVRGVCNVKVYGLLPGTRERPVWALLEADREAGHAKGAREGGATMEVAVVPGSRFRRYMYILYIYILESARALRARLILSRTR